MVQSPYRSPSAWVPVLAQRALRRRCPQCGVGPIAAGYGKVAKCCSECELLYRRESGALTGAMYLTAAVNQVFAALLVVSIFVFTDWSAAVSIAVALPLVLVFAFAFLPWSQSIWTAVEFFSDCVNQEPWATPPDQSRSSVRTGSTSGGGPEEASTHSTSKAPS